MRLAREEGSHNIVVVVAAGDILAVFKRKVAILLIVFHKNDFRLGAECAVFKHCLRTEGYKSSYKLVVFNQFWNIQIIKIIDKDIVLALMFRNIHLRQLIVVEGVEMVKMFLKEVEQDGDVRRVVGVFQLVRRQFRHNHGIVIDILNHVEERDADVADQHSVAFGVRQNVVDKGRGGAFALSTGHADDVFAVGHQEKFGLRTELLPRNEVVDIVEVDPR